MAQLNLIGFSLIIFNKI